MIINLILITQRFGNTKNFFVSVIIFANARGPNPMTVNVEFNLNIGVEVY